MLALGIANTIKPQDFNKMPIRSNQVPGYPGIFLSL